MEEINRSGGNSGACHGQMYNMGTLLRHGSRGAEAQYLPEIASGELRLQSMAVTEPTTGTDTTKIKTTAVKKGDRYVVNGQKVWISRVQHSDLMILLARTTPLAEVKKKSEGMSIFIVDLRQAIGKGMTVRPIPNMVNHETNELFFDNLEIPAENLIGEEGQGFKYILDGLNAERTLIAAECIGDGYWFIDQVTKYAKERVVFGRPIGQNQGVQFPIAEAYIEVEAANLMRFKACELFDAHQPCGAEANMAKYLAAKASWEAANACLQFHGGFGFANEYDVERKFRETRLYQVAPISTNLILSYVAEHVLGPAAVLLRQPWSDRSMASPWCRWSTRSPRRSARGSSPTWARASSRSSARRRRLRARLRRRVRGLASHFVWTNRSKESLTLDLKHPDALQALGTLLARADVLVQNLAPGAAARLGLSYEALHALHPRLIVCDISGYGNDGPYRDKKAYDLLIQTEAGFLSVTGTPEEPSKAGISIADIAAGMYAYSGILAALIQRQRTGEGCHIDVSMLESLAEWMSYPAVLRLRGASRRRAPAPRTPPSIPTARSAAGDGKTVMLGLQNEREWQAFCDKVLQQPALATDPRFDTNASATPTRRADAVILESFGQLTPSR